MKLLFHIKNLLKFIVLVGGGIQIIFGIIWMISNMKYTAVIPLLVGAFSLEYCLKKIRKYVFKKENTLTCWQSFYLTGMVLSIPEILHTYVNELTLPYIASGLFLLIGYTVSMEKRKTKIAFEVGICFVVFLAGCGSSMVQGQFESKLMSRFAWPYLYQDYSKLPIEIQEKVSLAQVREGVKMAGGLEQVLAPILDNKEMLLIAKVELVHNLVPNIKNIIWDYAGYHATPVMVNLQGKGKGYDSLTPKNYEEFTSNSPQIGKVYMTYGGYYFVILFVVTIIFMLLNSIGREKINKISWKNLLYLFLVVELMIIARIFEGSGIMDYREVIFVTGISYLLAINISNPTEMVVDKKDDESK